MGSFVASGINDPMGRMMQELSQWKLPLLLVDVAAVVAVFFVVAVVVVVNCLQD